MTHCMLNFLLNMFGGRRSRGFGGFGYGRRPSGLSRMFGGGRGMAMGSIASMAAPFLLRKLSARRQQRAHL